MLHTEKDIWQTDVRFRSVCGLWWAVVILLWLVVQLANRNWGLLEEDMMAAGTNGLRWNTEGTNKAD